MLAKNIDGRESPDMSDKFTFEPRVDNYSAFEKEEPEKQDLEELSSRSLSAFGASPKVGNGLTKEAENSKDLQYSDDEDMFPASFSGQTMLPKQNKLSVLQDLLKNANQPKPAKKDEGDFEQYISKLSEKREVEIPKIASARIIPELPASLPLSGLIERSVAKETGRTKKSDDDDDESMGIARFRINLSPKKAKQLLAE